MFRVPKRGMSRKACGRMLPYAAVIHRSGRSSESRQRKSSCHANYKHLSVHIELFSKQVKFQPSFPAMQLRCVSRGPPS